MAHDVLCPLRYAASSHLVGSSQQNPQGPAFLSRHTQRGLQQRQIFFHKDFPRHGLLGYRTASLAISDILGISETEGRLQLAGHVGRLVGVEQEPILALMHIVGVVAHSAADGRQRTGQGLAQHIGRTLIERGEAEEVGLAVLLLDGLGLRKEKHDGCRRYRWYIAYTQYCLHQPVQTG